MKEYRQGDTIHLTVRARDDHEVYSVSTLAFLEGTDDDHSDPKSVPSRHRVSLDGWPETPATEADVVIEGQVEQHEPGVYVCYAVAAENPYHAMSRHELDPPLRFRIVEHPDDVRDGPEVLSVGEFF